jgi:hypothetical protein
LTTVCADVGRARATIAVMHIDSSPAVVRDLAARAVGAVGLAGIGLIHLLDAPGKYSETPYMFWMYIGLMLGSIVLAGEILRSGSRLAWAGAAGLALSAAAGFTLTRTVGLPQAHGDVGNWTEPLGLASLWVEGCVAILAGAVLTARGALARNPGGRQHVPATA